MGGDIDEPSSNKCTHSIAMRKQTTPRPEKIPISTARMRKSWSSRRAKIRLVQDRQVAQRLRIEFVWGGDEGGGAAPELVAGMLETLIENSLHGFCPAAR